ncbi:ATP-dependent DNA helicase recG [Candidatus Photodesmus blepharus]|uniref:ATP-dependent DNA helicase RecG n=1 Tax=Candidatus Photodesmus blepharonis TaxID=1179155 RepID=A0A084CNA7_9GAMM|nr:ATP-dependent DNA helicase RecG [Candidatus Photodesmus blepharus]KEY91286.1 ATP-dependent DNA helicase recG [Candidatus Photodesmus blepharus]
MLLQLSEIPLTTLSGIGKKTAQKFAKIRINSVQDLLFHLPFRYEDHTHIYPINELYVGLYATLQGRVIDINTTSRKRKMLIVQISDGNSAIMLRFLNFTTTLKKNFSKGKLVRAYGKIQRSCVGLEILHPDYEFLTSKQRLNDIKKNLTPIYPTTSGLKQITLRNSTSQALLLLKKSEIQELLPSGMYAQQMTINQALHIIHRPPSNLNLDLFNKHKHPAQIRLIIEELLAQNLSTLLIRKKKQKELANPLPKTSTLKQKLLKLLPFELTNAQKRVVKEIETDLVKTKPMMRLVQGDVGSGKTLVAALSAIRAIEHNYQVALMAPTELLAEQHMLNFSGWFKKIGLQVSLLVGRLKDKEKKKQLARIATGEIHMIIGTHALFQKHVKFHNLALVVIDEQHRFGVHQRLNFCNKGLKQQIYPHQLTMTATPIPRTLAMTTYADLETSTINELPPGRTEIQTVVISDKKRDDIIERVHNACLNEGKQAYWVCPLIENKSEISEIQSVTNISEKLKRKLPNLKIGLIYGRMQASEKQRIMRKFQENELNLLVATTVIEVGVDIPNASLMIIENSERLGLTQLHQLRGRIGRGSVKSYCILLYHSPLYKIAQKRLSIIRQNNDGFIIAQKDLEIRGPGEFLGTKQTGLVDFKIVNLIRDQDLIPEVQRIARYMYKNRPQNITAIIDRWIGNRNIYSKV